MAIYLGKRTLVFGCGGITIHRHTRGTLDTTRAVFGVARMKRSK